jgi:hypothetical protein
MLRYSFECVLEPLEGIDVIDFASADERI